MMSWLLLCLLYIAIFFIVASLWWYLSMPKGLPPGPLGFPFIGCLPYIKSTTVHLTLEEWSRKYGNVFSFYMGNTLVLVLADYDACKQALIHRATEFNGRVVNRAFRAKNLPEGLGLTGAEDELWREQRRFCINTLKDFGVGRSILEPKIHAEVQFLCDEIFKSHNRPLDIQAALHYAVSNVIFQLVFGRRFDYDDPTYVSYLQKLTFRLSSSGVNAFSSFNFIPWLLKLPTLSKRVEKVLQDNDEILDFIKRRIEEKRQDLNMQNAEDQPGDYVSAFLKAQMKGEGRFFQDDQLLIAVQQLFIAGAETSATTLRWAIWYMVAYPECQEKVFNEIFQVTRGEKLLSWTDRVRTPFVEATICEIQRMCNLAPCSITHRTVEDTKLYDYHIPKDAYVIPFLWNVHREDKYFPNFDQFRPERFLDENGNLNKSAAFVPFSLGKRVCLGESLAKMELFLFFTGMIQQFRFRFPKSAQLDKKLTRSPSVTIGVIISPKPFEVIAEHRK